MIKTGYNIEKSEVQHYQPLHHRGHRELLVWQPLALPTTTGPAPLFQGNLEINTTDLVMDSSRAVCLTVIGQSINIQGVCLCQTIKHLIDLSFPLP